MERYNRQILLPQVGIHGQKKLQQTKVLVIGAGGIGSPLLLYLAAAGIGHLSIADFDNVALHNLHRQVLFTSENLNQNKANTAAQILQKFNPDIHCQPIDEGLHLENAHALIQAHDIIIEGSDNFFTKYLVNDVCFLEKKPLVYGAIVQWEGQASVFNYPLSGSTYSPNLRDVFPFPPSPELSPACGEVGVIGPAVGLIASWMATETIKIALQLHENISHSKLFTFDLLNNHFSTFQIDKNPENPLHENWNIHHYDYETHCSKPQPSKDNFITMDTLNQWKQQNKDFLLVDVREAYEHEIENIGGINAPMGNLDEDTLAPEVPIIFYCSTAIRSQFVAKVWRDKGFETYVIDRS